MIKYRKCRWCGSEHLALATHKPPHEMKLYCLSCAKTQQWVGKNDVAQAMTEFAVIEDTSEKLTMHQQSKNSIASRKQNVKSDDEIFRPRAMRDTKVW